MFEKLDSIIVLRGDTADQCRVESRFETAEPQLVPGFQFRNHHLSMSLKSKGSSFLEAAAHKIHLDFISLVWIERGQLFSSSRWNSPSFLALMSKKHSDLAGSVRQFLDNFKYLEYFYSLGQKYGQAHYFWEKVWLYVPFLFVIVTWNSSVLCWAVRQWPSRTCPYCLLLYLAKYKLNSPKTIMQTYSGLLFSLLWGLQHNTVWQMQLFHVPQNLSSATIGLNIIFQAK